MWYELSCRDRILSWRNWRKSLDELSWHECLNEVAKSWNRVPQINHYLTPDQVNQWPNPWELINDNIYCDLSIALGMFYSLILTKHPEAESSSINIYNSNNGWINLCIVNNGICALNWILGSAVNTSTLPTNTMSLNFSYTKIDLSAQLD